MNADGENDHLNTTGSVAVLQAVPEIIIDDIGINSVSLAWWLPTNDIAKSMESKQKIRAHIAYAEVPQPWVLPTGDSNSSTEAEKQLKYQRVRPQQSAPVMDYGGFGARPKTLSTVMCGELTADSQYAFRLELDILNVDDLVPTKVEHIMEEQVSEEAGNLVSTLIGKPVYLDTRPETLFILDPNSCGPNLVLTNNNLSVTNTVNKKWNAIRASACFSSGLHFWEVHIDKCVSKNIFVGVMSEERKH